MLTKLPASVNDDMFSFTSIINAITFYVSDNTIHGKKKKKKALSYMSVHKLDFDPKCNRHFSHSV